MELFTTSSALINFVSTIEAGTGRAAYLTTDALLSLISERADLFDADYIDSCRDDINNALPDSSVNCVSRDFAIAGVSAIKWVAVVEMRRDYDSEAVRVKVTSVRDALCIAGRYFTPFVAKGGRNGLALMGGAENVKGREDEHPNYFSKPTAKTLRAWVDYTTSRDAANRADIAAVEEERNAIRQSVEASGLQWSETSSGLRVYAGPLFIDVEFYRSGYSCRTFVNNNVTGYGNSILDYAISTFGTPAPSCTTPEEPAAAKQEPKQIVFHAFRRLATVEADGVEVWTTDAVEVMKRAMSDESHAVRDICRRAMAGDVRMSKKQRWCVAYAYARAV